MYYSHVRSVIISVQLDNVTGDLRSEGVDGGILPGEGRRGRSRRCRVGQKEGYAGKTK